MRQRNTIAINAPFDLVAGNYSLFRRCDEKDSCGGLAQLGGARLVIGNVFCVTGTGLSHFRTQRDPHADVERTAGASAPFVGADVIPRRRFVARDWLAIKKTAPWGYHLSLAVAAGPLRDTATQPPHPAARLRNHPWKPLHPRQPLQRPQPRRHTVRPVCRRLRYCRRDLLAACRRWPKKITLRQEARIIEKSWE